MKKTPRTKMMMMMKQKKRTRKKESKDDKKDSDSDEDDDDDYLPNDKEDTPCDHFTEKGCKDVSKRCEVKERKCRSKARMYSERATSAKKAKGRVCFFNA